jgi:hypothetical protein
MQYLSPNQKITRIAKKLACWQPKQAPKKREAMLCPPLTPPVIVVVRSA